MAEQLWVRFHLALECNLRPASAADGDRATFCLREIQGQPYSTPGALGAPEIKLAIRPLARGGQFPLQQGALYSQAIVTLGGTTMNLEIWLPAMFLLGIVTMGLCYAFLIGCERI